MKIYTEIVWSWDDDKGELVQESSKSYDYEGPLTLAHANEKHETTYLQYPSTIGTAVKHWISFSAFSFKDKDKKTLDVALYIPGDALSTSYKADYETTALGSMGAVGPAAAKAIKEQGGLNVEAFKQVMGAAKTGMQSEGKKVMLLKAGAKANVKLEGAKAIMEKAEGAVLNPYITAAYKGPTDMRTHEFTFQMLPQSQAESSNCTKIATAFKTAMLPSHKGGDSQTAPSMLFGYPDEFEISFKVNGKRLPESASNPLFKIGRSVLTACDVDFATESVPLFFDKTQNPVSISMKLSFMELEVMYREKIAKGF